jgi:hypothetical protein
MNLTDLKTKLDEYGIDTTRFGRGNAKTLEHLLAEVESGESELAERCGKIVRHLAVLNISIFTDVGGRRCLVEDRQEFADGRVRRRKLSSSVSEKLHKGESPLDSIGRALEEELRIRNFSILSPLTESSETSESPSFPGLLSEYLIYKIDVLIDQNDYKETYRETQVDKSTFFVWR